MIGVLMLITDLLFSSRATVIVVCRGRQRVRAAVVRLSGGPADQAGRRRLTHRAGLREFGACSGGSRYVQRFYWKAYEDNLTGLSGMVAYNLLLSILPLALIALFIAGRVLQSGDLEASVLRDLRNLFPSVADTTLTGALEQVQTSGRLGVRGAGGQRVDRLVVLGCAGHCVLSHLPRAMPRMGEPEGLLAGHAGRRAAVHGRHGGGAHAPEPSGVRRPAAPVRAVGGAQGWCSRSAWPRACCCCSRSCA